MTIQPDEAGAMLADVETIVRKVKQSRLYRLTGAITILWGAIVIAGHLISTISPRWSGWAWLVADALGVGATIFLLQRRSSKSGARLPLRWLAAFAIVYLFGFVWSVWIGRFEPRQLEAFWPTLFLFGYALAGLWFGAAFTFLGIGLTALILAGYLWSGDWFSLWLALVNGGGFILCGLWMRRA
jgi:hypothetical protein